MKNTNLAIQLDLFGQDFLVGQQHLTRPERLKKSKSKDIKLCSKEDSLLHLPCNPCGPGGPAKPGEPGMIFYRMVAHILQVVDLFIFYV